MQYLEESYDLVVCGGGLAGFCAAISAARHGAKVCLVQDRPVLGGNSSSEVRVTPHGAAMFHAYSRETGILSELFIAERAVNHETIKENGWTNSVWDLEMYNMVQNTPGLTLHLNTTVTEVVLEGDLRVPDLAPHFEQGYALRPACNPARRIQHVIAQQSSSEKQFRLSAPYFMDCTGDSTVAHGAGCEWRMGAEGRAEFNEPHAPLHASTDTMGNSLHFKARDMGRPVPFAAPSWAMQYEDASFFYDQGRHFYSTDCGFWWIEIGVPWHTIHDSENIRHELTRHVLGIWDWMKNRDPKLREQTRNLALDWVGQVPGKRESRRVMGRYLMHEQDAQERTIFPDEIAYGGWFIDLHTAGGLLAPTAEPASAEGYKETTDYAIKSYAGPYGVPLRSLIAKDIDNLLLAGRNISVSRAALGTVRVMATTALMGQGAGTAVAMALKGELCLPEPTAEQTRELRQRLLRDGCFLLNTRNEDAKDLARTSAVSASSDALLYGAAAGGNEPRKLTELTGQLIAVDNRSGLTELSLCLSNLSSATQTVQLRLVRVDHVWDYRASGAALLAEGSVLVPPGKHQWLSWKPTLSEAEAAELSSGREEAVSYVRLDALPQPEIIWESSPAVAPGLVATFEMGQGRMRRLNLSTTLSFKVSPPQRAYPAQNVLSGVTRPYEGTNLWRSDPAQPLPQHLDFTWPEPQTISVVELTFAGHLLKEFHFTPPLSRDAQTAKNYAVLVPDAALNTGWRTVLEVTDNFQRHCRHTLSESVVTQQLRLQIRATNGDPSAAVYEVRCYGPTQAS